FFFQAEDGIRDRNVTGVQTCALPISKARTLTIYDFLTAHADSVVANCQSSCLWVTFNPNLELLVRANQFRTAERLEPKPVKSIGSVGDEFPKKDFLLSVKRMNHQVQNLTGLGLELKSFGIGV